MEKIGRLAYKIQLPDDAHIHPVFHVSQLKKHLGMNAVPLVHPPLVSADDKVKTEPVAVLGRRIVPRGNAVAAQWLIQWQNLALDEAALEDVSFIRKVFPNFQT